MPKLLKSEFDIRTAKEKHTAWLAKYLKDCGVEDGCIVLRTAPARRLSVKQIRLERERAAGNGWTKAEWNDLVIECEGKCLRCGSDSNQIVPDHIQALSQGGQHSIENIQPLCYICNIWKGLKTIDFRYGYAFEVA